MHNARIRTLLTSVLLVGLAACSGTTQLTINSSFPEVVAEPRDIHAALVFDEAFRTYIARPNAETQIGIGKAQIDLLTNAFEGLFSEVSVIQSRDQLPLGTELVIIPSVLQVQLSSPDDSYLNVYEVWIKYQLDIETASGTPVDSWFLPAYGKTPDSMLKSRKEGIQLASIVALRDAGAKLLLDFYRIPAVHGWYEQHQQNGGNT